VLEWDSYDTAARQRFADSMVALAAEAVVDDVGHVSRGAKMGWE